MSGNSTSGHAMTANLEVFLGETTAAYAQLYVRLPSVPNRDGQMRLAGSIKGPSCVYARSLPATISIEDQGAGPSVLALARIPDPCCWTMDLPATYELRLELIRGTELLEEARLLTGIRRIGAAGSSFSMDASRWVLRGAVNSDWGIDPYRESRLVKVSRKLTAEMCEAATIQGLMLAWTPESPTEFSERLIAMANWPCLVAVVAPVGAALKRKTPNLLLGRHTEDEWVDADFVYCESKQLKGIDSHLPMVAWRKWKGDPRQGCDQLQSDLTPANLAGYVVDTTG